MATHTLYIDGWHPARLNELLGCHWAKAGRRKKFDRDTVKLEAVSQGIAPATGPRRVEVVIVLAKGQRAGDSDAYWKSLLDALVKAGLLVDDNRQNCELVQPRFERGARKATEIILTDLQAEARAA